MFARSVRAAEAAKVKDADQMNPVLKIFFIILGVLVVAMWAAASIASWRMGVVCWTWELSRSWLLCACAGGALAAGLCRDAPRSGVSVRQG